MNQLLAICDRETILVKTLSAYLKDRFHFPIMAYNVYKDGKYRLEGGA